MVELAEVQEDLNPEPSKTNLQKRHEGTSDGKDETNESRENSVLEEGQDKDLTKAKEGMKDAEDKMEGIERETAQFLLPKRLAKASKKVLQKTFILCEICKVIFFLNT